MQPMTMDDVVYLCDARWADPEAFAENQGNRVEHVSVHVYRHRRTGRLHVILFEDERCVSAPTYVVKESELTGLPPGGLPC